MKTITHADLDRLDAIIDQGRQLLAEVDALTDRGRQVVGEGGGDEWVFDTIFNSQDRTARQLCEAMGIEVCR